ncbi:flagellar biosynthetic protein FliO [Effusibacillus dendaii]|uniref:Flagellar protein n=1 Tax=Effusibacillus dendaii TaxID=2743772 RepID=A0A7I8D562_9BACL|nr:flagellar biosynthetic protein FliO [Effusibacillus dendaii]BCJ85273.1 hypothetical protein skT53_02580 [Effusibacillus dendaii]
MRLLALGKTVQEMIEQGNNPANTQQVSSTVGNGNDWSLLFGILQMIVVLGLVVGVVYLFIKFLAMKTNAGQANSLMRSIAVHPLATNRSIHLVHFEDRVYVIGVGEDVTLLDTILDEESVARLKQHAPAATRSELPSWLTKWLPVQLKQDVEEPVESVPFHDALQEKLRQLKEQRRKITEWESEDK